MTRNRRISYANVVATLALFLALGGTGYAAAKISGSQIKANTITSRNIKDGSLLVGDFASSERARLTGARGTAGPAGPAGPAGAAGTAGLPGANGRAGTDGATKLTIRVGDPLDLDTGQGDEVAALCDAGEKATGGGVDWGVYAAGMTITATGPLTPDGSTPTGWFAEVANTSGATREVYAYAVCAAP